MAQSTQQPHAPHTLTAESAAGPAPKRAPTFAALNEKASSPPPIESTVLSSDPPKENAPASPLVKGYGPVFVPPHLMKDQPTFKFAALVKDAKGKGVDRGGEEPAQVYPTVFSKPVFSKPVFTRPSPPPEPAAPAPEVPLPASDDSIEEVEAALSSPYARPERVPLGQLDKAALVARFGREAIAEDDPSRGKDTGTVYEYPPAEPQNPDWFADMRQGIVDDEDALAQEIERIRGLVDTALVESTLAEAELDEELEGYDRLLDDIERVAGPAFVEYLMEKAEQTWLPRYEVDDYEDGVEDLPQEDTMDFTEDFTGSVYPPMVLQEDNSEMMDQSRPSDTLSYLDASPRTSPLANRSAKRRHATEQPELESPSKRLRSNAPEPTSSAVYNRQDRSSQSPHGPPSQNGADPSQNEADDDDDDRAASDEEDNDEVDDYEPPPQPQWYEESTPSPSDDSDHSDLVSPDAPLPRGWPDNMSPRFDWLKKTTAYDLYKNPISPPGKQHKAICVHREPDDEHEDELIQGRPEAGPSGQHSEENDEPEDPEADADEEVPEAEEEQAEDSGVDVSGEQVADDEMEDVADDEVEEDQLQDDEEVDQLQDDDEGEAGPSQPVPAPSTPPRMTRRSHRQLGMSSPRQTRDPFHPTPRSRDFKGRKINHSKYREDNGYYESPRIT
ncbi:hypothetical protein VTO73DRAFT_6306 [Trametes versicolor]